MKLLVLLFIFFQTLIIHDVYAESYQVLTTRSIRILYPQSLESAAKDVASVYPEIKRHLEQLFEWQLYPGSTVLLLKDKNHFLSMSRKPLIVAFAVPEKRLIVVDYSRIIKHPFKLKTTLIHEFCHLLTHAHLSKQVLPRWLDEGLCQWASGGIDEIMVRPGRSFLTRATLTNRLIRFSDLRDRFPSSDNHMILAYEQSKSFVTYLFNRFGKKEMLDVLARMKYGENLSTATETVFSIPLESIETEWQRSMKMKASWFTLLTSYLYELLFFTMAMITMIAFIRYRIRKKRMHMDDDDLDETT